MHRQERISDIDVSPEIFQDYLKGEAHREYQEFLTTIIRNQGTYETSWIATNGGEQRCNDKTLLLLPSDFGKPHSDLQRVSCNEAFDYLDALICNHNGIFYDSGLEKGVIMDILIGKRRSNLARYSGKERSICLTPYIEGVTKGGVMRFIKDTMKFKRILTGLNKNPLESPNLIKGTKTYFLTCCNRITGEFFYLYNRGFNMAVLLPDTDLEINARRNIPIEKIIDCPEINLLSFMANYLKSYIEDCHSDSIDTTDEDKAHTKKLIVYDGPYPWEKPTPRKFPDGEPIELYAALPFIRDIPPEHLLEIFKPLLNSNGNSENTFALCALVTNIVRSNELALPNNPEGFRTSFPIGWESFFRRRISEIERTGGYPRNKVLVTPEHS